MIMRKILCATAVLAGLFFVCNGAARESCAAAMKISVTNFASDVNGKDTTVIYELNSSAAAKSLSEQLPLELEVEDYSNNEKIFYPPEQLDTSWSPIEACPAGTLAYYAPWGNVVMFYGPAPRHNGLYVLGHAVSGAEHISGFAGTILVERFE